MRRCLLSEEALYCIPLLQQLCCACFGWAAPDRLVGALQPDGSGGPLRHCVHVHSAPLRVGHLSIAFLRRMPAFGAQQRPQWRCSAACWRSCSSVACLAGWEAGCLACPAWPDHRSVAAGAALPWSLVAGTSRLALHRRRSCSWPLLGSICPASSSFDGLSTDQCETNPAAVIMISKLHPLAVRAMFLSP